MKRIVLIFSILSFLVIGSCNNISEPKISEEQAKSIVLKNHIKNIGEVKIISVSLKGNEYIVKWEYKENCENGTDYVDIGNGEITKSETSIC
ncbi:PepSY domain-containing protein [Rummeliibacillus pycnus]|uniref:PepSY domain-containing protein n=1 Tax=Rummeliibacillus pycnus TaxID=101070 RepID=UPI003D274310